MVILSPTTSEQEFNILPRDPSLLEGHTLVITAEGSKTSETITGTDLGVYENKDMICISAAYSILKEDSLYKIAITDEDGNNWWRGKARCTAQTDYTEKHDNNSVAIEEYITLSDDETYTTLL